MKAVNEKEKIPVYATGYRKTNQYRNNQGRYDWRARADSTLLLVFGQFDVYQSTEGRFL